MCGRYAVTRAIDEIRRIFQAMNPPPNWPGTWNMAPTREAPVIRRHPKTGERHLDLLRWGLVPHWAKDPAAVRQPINARSETAATAPMVRAALRERRCIVPADLFYEWRAAEGGKVPHAIARGDGAMLAFAGLWEWWKTPEGGLLRSYTILTTAACPALRPLHERMPVVLEAADWPVWLGEMATDETAGEAAALMRPSAAAFRVWPVSRAVNNVRNDGPELAVEAPALPG